MGGSVVAGHVTGAARLGRVVKVVVIVWLLPISCGAFPRLALFQYRGGGCFCQVGKGFNVFVSANGLIVRFLLFNRGYQ